MIGHQRVQLGEPGDPCRKAPPVEYRSALIHDQHVVVGLGPIDAHEDHLLPPLGFDHARSEPEKTAAT